MTTDSYEFPDSENKDLIESYLSSCVFSRAAHSFLMSEGLFLFESASGVQCWYDEDDQPHYAWCLLQRVGQRVSLRVIHLDGQPDA